MEHMANETGYKTGSLMYCMTNVHIYDDAIDACKELLVRTTADFSKPINVKVRA